MNKDFKVFQLHGLSGLFLLGFIIVSIFCGLVLFPIWVIMTGWNELVGSMLNGPAINYYQAFLLWMFVALCSYLALKNNISIKIQKGDQENIDIDFEEITEKNFSDDEDIDRN